MTLRLILEQIHNFRFVHRRPVVFVNQMHDHKLNKEQTKLPIYHLAKMDVYYTTLPQTLFEEFEELLLPEERFVYTPLVDIGQTVNLMVPTFCLEGGTLVDRLNRKQRVKAVPVNFYEGKYMQDEDVPEGMCIPVDDINHMPMPLYWKHEVTFPLSLEGMISGLDTVDDRGVIVPPSVIAEPPTVTLEDMICKQQQQQRSQEETEKGPQDFLEGPMEEDAFAYPTED